MGNFFTLQHVQQKLDALVCGFIQINCTHDQAQRFPTEIISICVKNLLHIQLEYESDFDENGLFYCLGTNWKKESWENPASRGIVIASSSDFRDLANDSHPATAICGRQTVRCVCRPTKYNWFMVDLQNLYVMITHYTLRHYNSEDTECLRHWNLEGSNDLNHFSVIHEHRNDTSLNGRGSSHTWKVDAKGRRYRAFRIKQYAANSNRHWYLPCSGIEIYGEVHFAHGNSIEMPIEWLCHLDPESGDVFYERIRDGVTQWDRPKEPVKPHWLAHLDAKCGELYFENINSGVTQWNKPDEFSDPDEQWIARLDADSGDYYYENVETQKTQWEAPACFAEKVPDQEWHARTGRTTWDAPPGVNYN